MDTSRESCFAERPKFFRAPCGCLFEPKDEMEVKQPSVIDWDWWVGGFDPMGFKGEVGTPARQTFRTLTIGLGWLCPGGCSGPAARGGSIREPANWNRAPGSAKSSANSLQNEIGGRG